MSKYSGSVILPNEPNTGAMMDAYEISRLARIYALYGSIKSNEIETVAMLAANNVASKALVQEPFDWQDFKKSADSMAAASKELLDLANR